MELHLVPDTNFFFEFKTLEQLPWEELGHDPVVLLLTKPVLDEIDKHKRAVGRTRDRALGIYGRVRAMLSAKVSDDDIRTSGPRVLLRRATNLLPDPSLGQHLDFDKTDERLIGIVAALNSKASGHEVQLFTDDTGPAGLADDLGVPYRMIDPDWRRPPAETTDAKKIRELQKDLALYRDQEPKIAIDCVGADADGKVRFVRRMAAPLDQAEIEGLLDKLRLKHPLATEFVAPAPSTETAPSGETKTVVYSAPSTDDIAAYRDVRYPRWIEECRRVLQGLHIGRDEPEPTIVLRWSMCNEGTRPAKTVRVEFEAQGPLQLLQIPDRADEEATEDEKVKSTSPSSRLPSPPKPPTFGETVTHSPAPSRPKGPTGFDIATLKQAGLLANDFKAAAALVREFDRYKTMSPAYDEVLKAASGASRLMTDPLYGSQLDRILGRDPFAAATSRFDPMPIMRPYIPPKHEPEVFYYSSWRSKIPVSKGAFRCDFWRHQTDAEVFEFEVVVDTDEDAIGAVTCEVHADNLTRPGQKKVVVERKIEPASMVGLAESLIEGCR